MDALDQPETSVTTGALVSYPSKFWTNSFYDC